MLLGRWGNSICLGMNLGTMRCTEFTNPKKPAIYCSHMSVPYWVRREYQMRCPLLPEDFKGILPSHHRSCDQSQCTRVGRLSEQVLAQYKDHTYHIKKVELEWRLPHEGVGQSPVFYNFDTPWFLIPHSFTHTQCSHFSRDTINATSAISVKSLYEALSSQKIHSNRTQSLMDQIEFHCSTHLYNII